MTRKTATQIIVRIRKMKGTRNSVNTPVISPATISPINARSAARQQNAAMIAKRRMSQH